MFVTALLSDTVTVAPSKFAYDLYDMLVQEIEDQYVNKVRCVGRCAVVA